MSGKRQATQERCSKVFRDEISSRPQSRVKDTTPKLCRRLAGFEVQRLLIVLAATANNAEQVPPQQDLTNDGRAQEMTLQMARREKYN